MGVLQFTPTQLPQHLQEDVNASNYPIYAFGGAQYLFMSDGVGFGGSGGGTSNIFIYKTTDNGTTWTDVTPGSPVKTEGHAGLIFLRSGNVVYLLIGNNDNQTFKMFGFDLSTVSWITDGPNSGSIGINGNNIASQAVVRTNGEIVCLLGTGGAGLPNIAVYNPTSALWTYGPTTIPGITKFEVLGGCLDSVGHIHFFMVTWSGGSIGAGTGTLQHIVVFADNSTNSLSAVYTFAFPTDAAVGGGSGDQVSLPVAYFDVTSATHMLGIAIAVPNASGINTSLILLTAPQSDTPVWTTTVVPTGENFAAVSLANAGVSTDSPVVSLLPVQFTSQTQLVIFWTSNGQFFASGHNPWNNFFRYIVLADGGFSAVTTLFSSLNTKVTPGPIYPVIESNSGTAATVGGMFPTIDQALFFSPSTKYSSLSNWWLTVALAHGGGLSLSCNNPPLGQIGVFYSHALVATGGTPPYTFSIAAGALPPGLSLNPMTGVISGIPTVIGTFGFTAEVGAGSALSILYTTVSPQKAQLIKFDAVALTYGAASVPIPSAASSTYGVMQVVLSDGTVVVLYRQGLAVNPATVESLYLATYTDGGGWANVDTLVATILPGSDHVILLSMFVDANNRVHIVYQDQNGGTSTYTTSYKSWTAGGGLSSATLLGTDISNINPAWTRGLFLSASDTICLLFHKHDNNVYEYTGTPSAAPVFSQALVASGADQPDAAAPQPMSMLLNSAGTTRFAVWWASGLDNTISYRSNSGAGWGGPVTRPLNVTAANWTLTSPDNGAALLDGVSQIAAVFDITGNFPNGGSPFFPETAVYMTPAGVTQLVDAIVGENAEMPVSLNNVTGAPVFQVGSNLLVVLDYYEPTTGSERVSVWLSADSGATWAVQDDAHAPSRLPNSAFSVFGATATVSCSITIQGSMWPVTDGGGGGWECRVAQCIPHPAACPEWGPISLAKQQGRYVGIYRDSRGQVRQFSIDPHIDAINQLAAGVMRFERGQVDPRANNPGRLLSAPGQIGEYQGAAVFATLDDGVQALKDTIMQALVRLRREVF